MVDLRKEKRLMMDIGLFICTIREITWTILLKYGFSGVCTVLLYCKYEGIY